MTSKKLVVGVVGMAGSGKSVVVNMAMQMGYEIVVMGDEVRDEAMMRGMELTPENLGKVMLELRQKEGENVIARRCTLKIEKTPKQKVLVDGIRSLSEVEEFKKHFPAFTSISVHSSPKTRFQRLYNRRRSDDPKNWVIFHERDVRELSVGLGNAIAMAEHIIVNEGALSQVKDKVREVLRKVETQWIR